MKRERQTEAQIKNFTPLLDELVQEFGVITAAVWGRVWRYAQQENHVCQASHEKIAKELGLSLRTVVSHIHILVKNGYLKDHSPNVKNVPHTYSITQKARILVTVEAVVSNEEGMQEMHTGMQNIPNRYANNAHEETIKETNDSLSLIATEGGRKLQELLAAEYSAKGRRSPKNFNNLEIKNRWLKECEARLSPADLEKAIRAAFAADIIALPRLVAYVSRWGTQPRPVYAGSANGKTKQTAAEIKPSAAKQDDTRGVYV